MKTRFDLYFFLFLLLGLLPGWTVAQFAPPAGQAGSTAISKDDERFVAWAKGASAAPGWINISDESLGKVSIDSVDNVLGPADGSRIISLGDGGSITMTFEAPIRNGDGFDFAVFENAFRDDFLELAFVEVSSDGQRFVRFPATSNVPTDVQTGTFGLTDTRLLNNLAGKYIANFGTPFDLEELRDSSGLELDRITHVRVVDVVGSINDAYASYDAQGQAVNDPWPTPFASGGFDLDAVGVLYQNLTLSNQDLQVRAPICYPNPVSGPLLHIKGSLPEQVEVYNLSGQQIWQGRTDSHIPTDQWVSGLYLVKMYCGHKLFTQKIVYKGVADY